MQTTKTARKEQDLMRQKVNVSDVLLQHWKENFLFHHRNMVNGSLLKQEDLGTEFEFKDRRFKIIGMTFTGTMMVEEIREEGKQPIYWECARYFVQFCLGRFISEFFKIKGKSLTRPRDYARHELLLPPIAALKKMKVEKEEEETQEQQPTFEIFTEDNSNDDYNNEFED